MVRRCGVGRGAVLGRIARPDTALRDPAQEAGYDPDISNSLQRINLGESDESDDEAPSANAEAVGAPQPSAPTAKPAREPEAQPPPLPPRRYGVVMHEEAAGAAVTAAAAAPSLVAAQEGGSAPAADVLRRVFPRDHPGVGTMAGWLAEEGVHTAAQLGVLLAGGGAKGGAAALRDIGFRPEWAAATAAGFARAAAAAEKASS